MSASAAEVGRKVICADGWRVTMHVEVRRGPLQGPDSERQGPTNRMSAAMFSGSPHSTRATISDRTERQVTSEAADEATGTRRSTRSASTRISLPARCSTVVIGDTVRVAITEPCPPWRDDHTAAGRPTQRLRNPTDGRSAQRSERRNLRLSDQWRAQSPRRHGRARLSWD